MRIRAFLILAVAAAFLPGLVLAAPSATAGNSPADAPAVLTVSPASVAPGQRVHVTVRGAPLNEPPPLVFCLGMYGPGQNGFTGQSPGFRVQIGTITVGAAGSGQADATVPSDLTPGTYQVVVGGCAPHDGLAPLAWFAAARLAVGPGASPAPRIPAGLPRTGGPPRAAWPLALGLGFGLAIAGLRGRRRA